MTTILLSHPHANTVANRTAAALARVDMLSTYITGVAAAGAGSGADLLRWVGRSFPVARNRIVPDLDPRRLRSLAAVELCARMVARAARPAKSLRLSVYEAIFTTHDAAVSLIPWPSGIDAVYGYEDAALFTFERAARRNIERIWDLPIPHYRALDRMWIEEAWRWPGAMGAQAPTTPQWKARRKDREMALANRIVVPSSYTAQSVLEAGTSTPIITLPFGFPLEDFPARTGGWADERPFTAIAVGTQDVRKGIPYLLEAWKAAALKGGKLRLIGQMKLARPFLQRYAGLFEHEPHVPRAELAREYAAADVVVLPTLGDGCAQAMQEAMCCGTPVITTRCGSGPDLITHDRDGWLVPERDVDALVTLIRALARDRDRVRAAGRAARQRAESWTWKEAGKAISVALR